MDVLPKVGQRRYQVRLESEYLVYMTDSQIP